jgi:hypothetical protein
LLIGEERCEEALLALVNTLNDRDPCVRHEAARALARFGDQAVPVLGDAFPEADPGHREAIVLTLGMLIPSSRRAMQLLEGLREHPSVATVVERVLTIDRTRPTDWNRWVDRLGLWFLGIALVIGLADELLVWGGLLTRLQGISFQVAFGWGLIGAFGGAVMGAHANGLAGVCRWAKHLGFAGAIAGALVGQVAAAFVTPLVVAMLR